MSCSFVGQSCRGGFFGNISFDLVPFMSFFGWMFGWKKDDVLPTVCLFFPFHL
jgi:hypothetical protein